MWTRNQLAAFQRALAAYEKWLPMLEHLQELAKHAPQFADRITELSIRAENVGNLARSALAASTTPTDK